MTHPPEPLLRAARTLRAGGIVAYPTEGVYGLGCDPFDGQAVARILTLKGRDAGHGLIVIGSCREMLAPLAGELPARVWKRMAASWPGPVTWIVPAAPDCVPYWLTGDGDTVALRVTGHPIARALCEAADMPLVSTSANRHGRPPAVTALAARRRFGNALDCVVAGRTGGRGRPSTIIEALSGKILRT